MSIGFSLKDEGKSPNFGDCFVIFSNGLISFKFSRTKSFWMADIGRDGDYIRWYDLSLVRAMIFNEERLVAPITQDECLNLIEYHITKLVYLFTEDYYNTQNNLEKLEKERVEQLFGNK